MNWNVNWRKNLVFIPIALVAILMVAKGVWNEVDVYLERQEDTPVEQTQAPATGAALRGASENQTLGSPAPQVAPQPTQPAEVTPAAAPSEPWWWEDLTPLQWVMLFGAVVLVVATGIGIWHVLHDGAKLVTKPLAFFVLFASSAVFLTALVINEDRTEQLFTKSQQSIQNYVDETALRSESGSTSNTEEPGEFNQWLESVSQTPAGRWIETNTGTPWWGIILIVLGILLAWRLLRRNDAGTSIKTKTPSLKKGEVWAIAIVVIVIVSAVLGVVYGFLVWVEAVPAIGTTTASAGAQCATSETLTTTLNQQGRSVTVCKGSDSLVVYLPPGTRPQIEWDPNFMANNLGYTSKYQATDFVRDGGRRGVLSGNSRDWVLDVSQDYQGKPSAFAQAGLTAVTVWVTPVRQ